MRRWTAVVLLMIFFAVIGAQTFVTKGSVCRDDVPVSAQAASSIHAAGECSDHADEDPCHFGKCHFGHCAFVFVDDADRAPDVFVAMTGPVRPEILFEGPFLDGLRRPPRA